MDRIKHLNWEKRLLLGAALVAGVLVVVILLWPHKEPTPQTREITSLPLVSATPKNYTDFYGLVAEASPTLFLVRMDVTSETGQAGTKSYRVLISPETIVQERVDALAGPVYKTLKLSAIKIGDHVQAFGTDNLYPLTQFTATKFYLLR